MRCISCGNSSLTRHRFDWVSQAPWTVPSTPSANNCTTLKKKQLQKSIFEFPILKAQVPLPSSKPTPPPPAHIHTPPKPRRWRGATLIYLSVCVCLLLKCFKESKRNKGRINFTWNPFRLTRGVFFAFLKQTESHKHIINTVCILTIVCILMTIQPLNRKEK